MYDIDALRGTTPATIRAAFNKSKEILEEHGDMGNANATGIMTRIMQETGRFNERWASDALYGLDKIRALAEQKFVLTDDFDEIITFGIRQDGVDHNSSVMSNLLQTRSMPAGYVFPMQKYRKVLAVRLRAWADSALGGVRVGFSLRNISHALYCLDPIDMVSGNLFKLVELPDGTGKSPEPSEERDRADQEEIRKLKMGGYKTFGAREIPADALEKDGCSGSVLCVEIDGFWDPAVPAPKNPGDCAVCRVYLCGGKDFIVCWTDGWYEWYADAKAQVERAKAVLLEQYAEMAGTG